MPREATCLIVENRCSAILALLFGGYKARSVIGCIERVFCRKKRVKNSAAERRHAKRPKIDDKVVRTKGSITTLALAGALLMGGSLAKASSLAAIPESVLRFRPLTISISDAATTVFMLAGALVILIGIRARLNAKTTETRKP